MLKLDAITFLYERDIGVKNLNINLPKRSIYGFLGRNGAGKSTTLQILSGVLRPQHGTIYFKNESSPNIKTDWKKLIGYVPQNPVFPQNVNGAQISWFLSRLYPKWNDKRFAEMTDAFQLPLKRKIDTYSFGMQTMLSVALAYAGDPEIYILDEPTSGLDPVSRRIVLDMIKQEKENGKSIIFSTHIVDDLNDNCDYLGIIDHGNMLDEDVLSNFGNSKETLEQTYFQRIQYREIQAN